VTWNTNSWIPASSTAIATSMSSVDYAKRTPEDILIQISVCNRGPEPATIHVLPTLWFRNTWTWWPGAPKPSLKQITNRVGCSSVSASHPQLVLRPHR
jgi:hypothetical protein